jgi:hypothetical protein
LEELYKVLYKNISKTILTKDKEKIFITSGYVNAYNGHLIGLYYHNNKIVITNSGEGVENHEDKHPIVVIENTDINVFHELAALTIISKSYGVVFRYNINKYYENIRKILQKPLLKVKEYINCPLQLSGSCTFYGIYYWIKYYCFNYTKNNNVFDEWTIKLKNKIILEYAKIFKEHPYDINIIKILLHNYSYNSANSIINYNNAVKLNESDIKIINAKYIDYVKTYNLQTKTKFSNILCSYQIYYVYHNVNYDYIDKKIKLLHTYTDLVNSLSLFNEILKELLKIKQKLFSENFNIVFVMKLILNSLNFINNLSFDKENIRLDESLNMLKTLDNILKNIYYLDYDDSPDFNNINQHNSNIFNILLLNIALNINNHLPTSKKNLYIYN